MPVEIILAVLVLAVIILVGADFFRTASDSPHQPVGDLSYDAGQATFGEPRAVATVILPRSAGGRSHPAGGTARPGPGSGGVHPGWLVRTRLSLLAMVPAIAAVLVTVGVIRAADALRGASFHSSIGSMRDGAVISAVAAGIFALAVLAAGVASAIVLTRSVLRPLRKLQAGAVELAEVRLPDALRRITPGGDGPAGDVQGIPVSSSDEIGEVARACDQIQAEVLRLAANEAGLRGKLDEMFVDLSCRSQSLVERQIRLIDELEQGEQDTERLANLFKMDHIATRMRRYSQNLLVLAGHELPGRWNEPVTLVNVIRAAVSEIEEYDRVSFSVPPGIAISGGAVNDVVHLVAELAENATSLSASDTPVDISGRTLASGGVLVEVTDRGVGMNPDEMVQANWRLDNPAAADITVYKNMGLFVVGRLAARHGIKVRLQPAKSGGLTALVWLPDAVVAPQATRTGRPAVTDLDRGSAGRESSATSLRPAPVLADSGVGQRPDLRLRPLGRDQTPTPEPEAGPADERRLPIYEAVESDWFSNRHKQFVGPAKAEGSWAPAADRGWHAARAVIAPSSSGVTTAGLPVRVPRANLVPGAVGGPQAAAPAPARSAAAARDRLAGFQRGAVEGRTASGGAAVGDQDKSS